MDWIEAVCLGICLGNRTIIADLRKWSTDNAVEPFNPQHAPGIVWRAYVNGTIENGMSMVDVPVEGKEGAWQAFMRRLKEKAAKRKNVSLAAELRIAAGQMDAESFKKFAIEKIK